MGRYIRRPLCEGDTSVARILQEATVSDLLAKGCFLAGGAILTASFGSWRPYDSIEQYLAAGDIDAFALSEASHQSAMLCARRLGSADSVLKTAVNMKTQPSCFKLQLVDVRFSGPIEEVLEQFDIANCKVATDGKDLIYHEDVPDLERTRTLRLDKSPGFMLAWRVVKYMKHGYLVLDPASRAFIVDWFFRMRAGDWDLTDASRACNYSVHQITQFLGDRRLVEDEDLLLAISLMQMVVANSSRSMSTYHQSANEIMISDLAREELRKRLGLNVLRLPGDEA